MKAGYRSPFIFLALLISTLILLLNFSWVPKQTLHAQANLSVRINTAYNLVVDSNVTSPSTYAPRVATVYGTFCNPGNQPLTDVYGYIGNYNGGSGSTPGIYPARSSSDSAFQTQHPWAANTGNYAFTHVGGVIGAADATRFIGTLAPGECKVQYWHFTYPACANLPNGTAVAPPCTTTPTWGSSVKPDDDLWLEFDIWATGKEGAATLSNNARHRMTMRNEISAMANKIKPNPDGAWFNTDTTTIVPGQVITTNGVLYTLGNIRQGFDNDGDFVPDYNAWLQPFGDPSYDPSCFRLIRTSTVLTVSRSAGQPNLILRTNDLNPHPVYGGPLYFTNLPPDNNGVRGEVRYTFLALSGPCSVPITPYQEVASGSDNEKFNGDYGTGLPNVQSSAPKVTISKSGSPNSVAENNVINYSIPFANQSSIYSAGLTLNSGGVNMPLVVRDQVPVGLVYLANSAANGNTNPTGCTSNCYTIRYSTNGGASWTTADPGNTSSTVANPVIIEWWLTNPLPVNGNGVVTFQAQVPGNYLSQGGSAFITNEACANFGGGTNFACATDVTMVQGNHSIGDRVWNDANSDGKQDGGEVGIPNITVWLYWDANGNGQLDGSDLLIAETSTGANGIYGFSQLPPGNYLVKVDSSDTDLPFGYRHTTPEVHAVTNLNSAYVLADFGFGPTLKVNKVAFSGPDRYEGRAVNYGITVTNLRPGTGQTVGNSCVYELWPSTQATANPPKNFTNPFYAVGAPDGLYASGDFAIGAGRWIRVGGFDPGARSGTINSVEALIPLYLSAALSNDSINILLKNAALTTLGTGSFATASLNARVGLANAGNMIWAIPNANAPGGSWDWADFAQVSLELNPIKTGGADASVINLDTMGFRISVAGACPALDGNDTLGVVPLVDTYDTTYLEFVSADPIPTSVNTTTGLISWANVGPIAPGESRLVTVQFRAKNIGATPITGVANTAMVTGATFVDGGPANNDSDDELINILPTGTINGTVFSDRGTTGWPYVPGTDLPIPGIEVRLFSCLNADGDLIFPTSTPGTNRTCAENGGTWEVISTQVTNAQGFYEFVGLFNGFYYVQVNNSQLPGTVTQTAEALDTQTATGTLPNTTANGQTCGTCNSIWGTPTANLNTTNFNPINSPGETINGVNFGYTINPGVYGVIWEDVNGNGLRGSDEPVIQPVTVRLYANSDCSGTPTSTTTTVNGRYQFGNLTAGQQYCVSVNTATMPAVPGGSWTQTGETDGSVNNQITFTAVAGTLSGSHDFGFRRTGTQVLSGNVYADWNNNADFDGLDTGFGGIPVSLYNSSGVLLATTTTAPDGSYSFPGLANGTYSVVVNESPLPPQYTQTENFGENNGNGFCTLCGGRATVTLTGSGQSGVDFGYRPDGTGTIGDRVWRDNNGNGIQNPGEPGIANITVRLYVDYGDGSGYVLVRTTATDSNGLYNFTNLPPGSYRAEVDALDPDLPNDSANNRFVPTVPTTVNVTLSGGQTYLDADFGFAPGGVIGDTIYWDANGNADQDWNELGIPGVTVTLERWNGSAWVTYATDTTDASGNYLFTSLPAGQYRVVVDTGTGSPVQNSALTGDPDTNGIPCDPNPGAPWASFCDSRHVVNITPGQIYLGADFGYRPLGVIGDFVWLDSSNFGIQDAGEPGLVDVRVWLCNGTPCNAATAVMTTTTDFSGYYSFVNVGAGTWTVQVDSSTLPAGLTATYDLDSGTTNPDGVTIVTLAAGGSNFNADFGYHYAGSYSLSGAVFYDLNESGGDREAGEPGYEGQSVFLWQLVGGSYVLVGSTTTNANGDYSFANLPGNTTYRVSTSATSPILNNATHTTRPNQNNATAWEEVVLADANVTGVDFGFFIPTDFDDLPESYNTRLSAGPYHINSGAAGTLRLGAGISLEPNGLPVAAGTNANRDTYDDGVLRDPTSLWTPGATVYLNITVSGGSGVVGGWFDWNNNGAFGPGEFVNFGQLASGTHSVSVTIPNSGYSTGQPLYARFRVFDPANIPGGSLTADDYQGGATGGEVEGYYWVFSPTAVTLAAFFARQQPPVLMLSAAGMLAMLLISAAALKRRRRTA